MDELPSGHSKGGGFSSAALEGSAALPSGTDPRTGQRAPTQEPALQKGEKCFCPGVLSLPCPGLPLPGLSWFRVAGSPALPLRVCFLFRLMFLSTGRGRHVPAPSGRDVGSSSGTDPRTGFFRYPSTYCFVVYLVALVYLVAFALLFLFLFVFPLLLY